MPKNPQTLRLLFPQWQGGNNGVPYPFGARLLAWLAPESGSPLIEVPVKPYEGITSINENGVIERSMLLKQLKAARNIIDIYDPQKIIVFGGDCLVSQAPFAYLNEKYKGALGVLWIDAHPDVSTPKDFSHEHAMVLGNLLGEGDPLFSNEVKIPIDPKNVLLVGIDETLSYEKEVINRLNLKKVKSDEVKCSSQNIIDWIKTNKIKQLAIHLDLDVLDPTLFRSLLFSNPDAKEPIDAAYGKLSIPQVTRIIQDVEKQTNVVGLTYAEHMPWDAINLKNMMAQFDIMK